MFRPGENIKRFNFSARRMSMPEVPEDVFFQALIEMLKLDRGWVPSHPDSSLYIRPFMFATEAHVGVRPSNSFRFAFFMSRWGILHPPGSCEARVGIHRAAAGGTGAARPQATTQAHFPTELAKSQGYDQTLDRRRHPHCGGRMRNHERGVCDGWSACRAPTSDTVLSGVTRDSAIQLMRAEGIVVEERRVTVRELMDSVESGTLSEALAWERQRRSHRFAPSGFPTGTTTCPTMKIGASPPW